MKSLFGKNALTVFLADSLSDNLNMFFCPYTRNNVAQYVGSVEIIYPSYDTVQKPNIILRPQKLSKNIHYTFFSTKDKESEVSEFYIQYRTFDDDPVQVYYCYNCQAPQLYFSENKVVDFKSKHELKKGDEFVCPNCKKRLKYIDTVSISNPVII